MRGHSSAFSLGEAVRARHGVRTPSIVSSTSGVATRLRYQSGWRSSPPLDATSTTRSSSTIGAVSIVARGRPLVRPVVCSSTVCMPPKLRPSRPPERASSVRWLRFMHFAIRSVKASLTSALVVMNADSTTVAPEAFRYRRASVPDGAHESLGCTKASGRQWPLSSR